MSYEVTSRPSILAAAAEEAIRIQRARAAAARAARKAAAEAALRRRVERFRVPGADTSGIDQDLAVASARQHMLDRDVRAGTVRIEDMSGVLQGLDGDARAAWQRQVDRERAAQGRLETQFEEACARVEGLHEQRVRGMREVNESLQAEADVDAREASEGRARQQQMVEESLDVLNGVDGRAATAMGLDTQAVSRQIRTAQQRSGDAGLMAARQALVEAHGLADELSWRHTRLEAVKGVYLERIAELREQLQFDGATREELVGRGDRALDGPLHRRLDRIEAGVESVAHHEGHEARFVALGEDLDVVAARIYEIAGQVAEFDALDERRARVVDEDLPEALERGLGQAVTLVDVQAPQKLLQPVQVQYRTDRGERVDCAVEIDGTWRIHHHGHEDVRTCNKAAKRWARAMNRSETTDAEPVLDITRPHEEAREQ